MTTRRSLWCMCGLLALMLTACEGGSGSSGFDVHSENAAIQQALSTQQCVQHESLTICPAAQAGTPPSPTPPPPATTTPTATAPLAESTPTASLAPASPTGTPGTGVFTPGAFPTATPSAAATAPAARTATATATASRSPTPSAGPPQVDIGIDPTMPVICAAAEPSGGCELVLPFVARGFPAAATFRVAVRTINPNGPWVIGEALTAPGAATPSFDAPVVLAAPVAGTGTMAQAAVLVFPNPSAAVPASVAELVDTGAEAAFVTEPFTLQAAG